MIFIFLFLILILICLLVFAGFFLPWPTKTALFHLSLFDKEGVGPACNSGKRLALVVSSLSETGN